MPERALGVWPVLLSFAGFSRLCCKAVAVLDPKLLAWYSRLFGSWPFECGQPW